MRGLSCLEWCWQLKSTKFVETTLQKRLNKVFLLWFTGRLVSVLLTGFSQYLGVLQLLCMVTVFLLNKTFTVPSLFLTLLLCNWYLCKKSVMYWTISTPTCLILVPMVALFVSQGVGDVPSQDVVLNNLQKVPTVKSLGDASLLLT